MSSQSASLREKQKAVFAFLRGRGGDHVNRAVRNYNCLTNSVLLWKFIASAPIGTAAIQITLLQ